MSDSNQYREKYRKAVDRVKRKLTPRIKEFFAAIQKALLPLLCSDVELETGGSEYVWMAAVYGSKLKKAPALAGLDLTLCESLESDGNFSGVNFQFKVSINQQDDTKPWREVIDLCPFNFTKDVWVSASDLESVEKRLRFIEQECPAVGVATVIRDAIEEVAHAGK